MKVLITGGAGFLGQHLVTALLERGDSVRVIDRLSPATERLEKRGVTVFEGDIRRPDDLVEPMRGIDAVMHLAAMSGVWRSMADYCAVNVTGTENVCRAVLRERVGRLVHISSWTVYGMGAGKDVGEDSPLTPLRGEPYSVSKVIGDRLVQRMAREEGLPAVIIRPDTIFGPGDHQHVGRLAGRLRAGNFIVVGSGRNTIPFVYVGDIVRGLLLALDRTDVVGQAYNIASDHPITQIELLSAIAEGVGASPPRIRVPYAPLYATAVVAERVARLTGTHPVITRMGVGLFGADNRHSIDKARRELGYSPRMPVLDGIREATQWYRHEVATGAVGAPAASM